jgi:O-antigen/teichoic acid export membrane protein
MDWILLGLLSTSVITAEYTFAYRVFELTRMPIVILGPILFSRFSRLLADPDNTVLSDRSDDLHLMIRIEMILATLLPLLMSIIWIPLVEFLTHHKYGTVNKTTFIILSLSIPFHYLINFFWTIQFSKNKLALIFRITAIACFVIVAGNYFVIPMFNARGAATVYLCTMVIEFLLYIRYSDFIARQAVWKPLIICGGAAFLTGSLLEFLDLKLLLKFPLSIVIYFGLILLSGQFYKKDLHQVLKWAS